MKNFLIRRFVFSIITLLSLTLVVFVLSRLGPDPLLVFIHDEGYAVSEETVALIRAKWGLDRPVAIQYFVWLKNVARGDLGDSIGAGRPVSKIIIEKLGATLQLGAVAWVIATIVGVPLGILSAIKRGTIWDYFGRALALIGQATPSFWLALVMILIFSVQLGWLPSATRVSDGSLWNQGRHFILPALVLAFDPWATYLRLTRSSMLEVMDSEYIKLARAKGVGNIFVIWKHGLRNALIQPLTTSALVLASFITGALFVETIFAWPGIGRLAVQATFNNDLPVLTGIVLLFGIIYVGLNFLADFSYALVDPRIRYS